MDEINVSYLGVLDVPPENPMPGQWYEDSEGKKWICDIEGTRWVEIKTNSDGSIDSRLTLYDINKQLISKMPSKITEEQLKEGKEILKELKQQGNYFMLLCNDIHYYTVLKVVNNNELKFEDVVVELLQDNGVIQDIIWTDEDKSTVECWIKNETGTEMFLLFNYDWGVIECQ